MSSDMEENIVCYSVFIFSVEFIGFSSGFACCCGCDVDGL